VSSDPATVYRDVA